MPIGSEYFESDVATKPLRGQNQGLLFADDYDYDHDGENEVLILRNDPSLAENRASTDHLILEMYEYVNGRFEYSDSREFIAYGLTSTYSNHSFSVFRYDSWNEYGGGTYIALELYGQMNSQNTSVVALYYDGSGLIFVDGGNYGEWDGSDDMKSSFAVPATAENGFILDRNAEGFEHWTDWASSGIPMDEYVIEEFRYKLNALGLDLRILRSIYSDYNGTEGVARNAAYCGLIASDCYVPYEEYTSTELAMLGAISTEYAQAIQTLTRRDFTGLLDLFR